MIALASTVLFGLSTPLAKLLLGETDPWMLAGLLYGGAGVGLLAVHLLSRALGGAEAAWPAATCPGSRGRVAVGERHEHEHELEELAHDHRHVHDAHHGHEHAGPVDPRRPHNPWHRHARLRHAHPQSSVASS
ncbi:MAG: hypothetical protein U1E60_15360 [Reyranellaceae bacterium]